MNFLPSLALTLWKKGYYKLAMMCIRLHCFLWPYLFHKKWKANARKYIDKWEWL